MTKIHSDAPRPLPSSTRTIGKLAVKDWVTQVTTVTLLEHQTKIVDFLLKAYGCLLAASMLIFFLQGFRLWGFHLDASVLNWLGGATVGEIAGLLTLAVRAVFHMKKTNRE